MKVSGGIEQKFLLWLLAAAVALGTFFVVFSLAPEEVRLVSDDGCFVLTGHSASPQPAFSTRLDLAGPFTAVYAPVYTIDFGRAVLPEPFALSLCAVPALGPVENSVIYSYDANFGFWVRRSTVADPATSRLSVEISSPAELWAAGRPLVFTAPASHFSLLEKLLAFPPASAVGYRVFSSVATADGDFVLLDDQVDRGGCDGRFQTGPSHTLTTVEQAKDGANYRLTAVWELNGGCGPYGVMASTAR
jgi:hypothetical protein